MTQVIGYSFDADTYCVDCTLDYVRCTPYKDYVFGEHDDEDISDQPGIINLTKAIELEVIRDNEGNPIHPIFSTDEAGDTPDHCGDCHASIRTSWSGETTNYAIDTLWDYVQASVNGESHRGNTEVLDEWCSHAEWCTSDPKDVLVIALYKTTREHDNEHA